MIKTQARSLKVAIDGPSASGKGTVATIIAKKFNLEYLNTGRIYRIVAAELQRDGNDLSENLIQRVITIASNLKHLWEKDYGGILYTPENSQAASMIAVHIDVRNALLGFQKDFVIKNSRIIAEGRDICSIIMPNADIKIYLDANTMERARRRARQLGRDKDGNFLQQTALELAERDKRDEERTAGALKIAKDATYIDSSALNLEKVVQIISDKITNMN